MRVEGAQNPSLTKVRGFSLSLLLWGAKPPYMGL